MSVKDFLLGKKEAALVEAADYEAQSSQYDIELKAAEDKGFDMGVAQAGIPAGDKIYTEADLQAEKAILQSQIDAAKAKSSELEAKVVELENNQDFKVAQFKQQLKSKYEELQVIENQAETGFADLLA